MQSLGMGSAPKPTHVSSPVCPAPAPREPCKVAGTKTTRWVLFNLWALCSLRPQLWQASASHVSLIAATCTGLLYDRNGDLWLFGSSNSHSCFIVYLARSSTSHVYTELLMRVRSVRVQCIHVQRLLKPRDDPARKCGAAAEDYCQSEEPRERTKRGEQGG